jgi:hypothetical protein
MSWPHLSRVWIHTLLALAVEETAVMIFARDEQNLWVWVILLIEGALFAAPFLWYDQFLEKGLKASEMFILLLVGMAATWAASYEVPRLLYSKPIPKKLDDITFFVAFFAVYWVPEHLARRVFPRFGRLPGNFFFAAMFAFLLVNIWRTSRSTKLDVVFTFALVAFVAWMFYAEIRKIRKRAAESGTRTVNAK